MGKRKNEIRIRKIAEEDIDTVARIYENAFSHREGIVLKYYEGFSDYVMFCMNESYAYIAGDETGEYGVILGYEIPDMWYGKEIYIELLAVDPIKQRQGYGKALMKNLFDVAEENGIKATSIRTRCYMDSYEIYKKMGYKDMKSDMRYMEMLLTRGEDNK